MDRLKIYACSGVGSTQDQYNYWLDNTNAMQATQAVNSLLADINSCYIRATRLIGLTDEERIMELNKLDLLVVCLDAAEQFSAVPEKLSYAGRVIGQMDLNGMFDFDTMISTERDNHLDELLAYANAQYETMQPVMAKNPEFYKWWNANVVALNKNVFTEEQRIAVAKELRGSFVKKVSGDNWEDNADLRKYFYDAATYFMYTFFTEDQLNKLPEIFRTRRSYQLRVYNYCKALYVGIYGSEEKMRQIISDRIISEIQVTPEEMCKTIVESEGKTKSVGLVTEVIIAIITMVTTIAVAIISAVVQCVLASKAAKTERVPSKEDQEKGCPDKTDYSNEILDAETKASVLKYLPFAIGGLILYFMMSDD